MRMVYSTDIIINLSEHRQVFNVCFIINSTLFGYCMNLRDGKSTKVRATYNLDTGILEKGWRQGEPRVLVGKTYGGRVIECDEGTEGSYVPSTVDFPGMGNRTVRDVPWLNQKTERLITALASHQVKGDEIQKGLRVIVDLAGSFKLVENYLGGWNFTVDGRPASVAALIHAVAKAN